MRKNNQQALILSWINGCATSLGARSLIDVANVSTAKANYLCGSFINWLMNEWLQAAPHADQTVADIWRDLLVMVSR